jgi:hypothetical protein
MTMSRKQFLRTLAAGGATVVAASVVGSAAATLTGCGSDDDDGGGGDPNCVANGTNATIADNHGHTLNVAKADVSAGIDKTYDITGSAGHAHSITITAAQFATLAANNSVQVTSTSGGGHTHAVNVMCV